MLKNMIYNEYNKCLRLLEKNKNNNVGVKNLYNSILFFKIYFIYKNNMNFKFMFYNKFKYKRYVKSYKLLSNYNIVDNLNDRINNSNLIIRTTFNNMYSTLIYNGKMIYNMSGGTLMKNKKARRLTIIGFLMGNHFKEQFSLLIAKYAIKRLNIHIRGKFQLVSSFLKQIKSLIHYARSRYKYYERIYQNATKENNRLFYKYRKMNKKFNKNQIKKNKRILNHSIYKMDQYKNILELKFNYIYIDPIRPFNTGNLRMRWKRSSRGLKRYV